jgi:hypothetical protein
MVSVVERAIWYTGLIGIYGYGVYRYFMARSSFDQKYHDGYRLQAERFVKTLGSPNLKFVDTKTKLLFFLGADGEEINLTDYKIVEKLLEDFSPGFFIYERNLKKYIFVIF